MTDERDTPPASPELAVIGCVLAALEERYPGITNRAREISDDEFARTQVVRLRGPSGEGAIRKAMGGATAWLSRAALIADARRGWKWRKRHEV